MLYPWRSSGRFLVATLAAAFGLTACADQPSVMSPEDVSSPSFNTQRLGSDAFPEEIYITDSGLETADSQSELVGDTKLFFVNLDDTALEANLTLLSELSKEAENNGAAASQFDRVDALAATPDGESVVAIAKFTNSIGVYDVSADKFEKVATLDCSPLGCTENVVQASYSPSGNLFIAFDDFRKRDTDGDGMKESEVESDLYTVDLSTGTATQFLDMPDAFEFQGADIAFDNQGTMFIWTNNKDTGVGLYKIEDLESRQGDALTLGAGDVEFVGPPSEKPYYTGLAIRSAGTGPLVGSTHAFNPSNPDEQVFDPDPAGTFTSTQTSRMFTLAQNSTFGTPGQKIDEYETLLSGSDYFVGFGDATVGILDLGCTSTPGYWKNHTEEWPEGFDPNEQFFDDGTWLEALEQNPKGNPYFILAQQYIAARLNEASGTYVPSDVADALSTAEGWYTANPNPADPFWHDKTNKDMITDVAEVLDDYNNGRLSVKKCDEFEGI